MLMMALFTLAQNWRQQRSLFNGEWLHKPCSLNIMACYSVLKTKSTIDTGNNSDQFPGNYSE